MQKPPRDRFRKAADIFGKCEQQLGPAGIHTLIEHLREHPCQTPSGGIYDTLPSELMQNFSATGDANEAYACLESYSESLEELSWDIPNTHMSIIFSEYADLMGRTVDYLRKPR